MPFVKYDIYEYIADYESVAHAQIATMSVDHYVID
jgi:hypothetical protein